jgi:hypothetical protein
VNHITDWSDGDPSFKTYSTTHELPGVKNADDVLARLAIKEKPREVYESTPEELEILFDKPQRTLHVNTQTGHVVDEGQSPRLVLRVANWLHLNRGKKAWTYVADTYAAGLLFLALSGMFMIAGKKGLFGRGAILVALGVAIPVLYVTFAGP